MDRVAFTTAKAKVCEFALNIGGVRDWSKESKDYQKDAINREREKDRSDEENFYWRMKYLGVQGDERVGLVMSEIEGGGRQWDAVRRY